MLGILMNAVQLNSINARFSGIDGFSDSAIHLETRVSNLESRLDARFNSIDARFNNLEVEI